MFKFNISSVLSSDDASKYNVNAEEIISHIQFGKVHYRLLKPITLAGYFTKLSNEMIRFNGEIETTIQLHCSRCMEYLQYPISINFEQRFSTDFNDKDDEDIEVIEGNIIDLESVIMDEIKISIPMKVLCKEDCKGLCSVCGINLNEENCSCLSTDIDPRLSILKELYKQ